MKSYHHHLGLPFVNIPGHRWLFDGLLQKSKEQVTAEYAGFVQAQAEIFETINPSVNQLHKDHKSFACGISYVHLHPSIVFPICNLLDSLAESNGQAFSLWVWSSNIFF